MKKSRVVQAVALAVVLLGTHACTPEVPDGWRLNPEPPFTGASTRDTDPPQADDMIGTSSAVRADEQRLHDAMTAAVGDGFGFRRGIPERVSWTDVTAFYDAALGAQGLRRDTTFRAYPLGSQSHAALWTLPGARRGAVAVALIETRRPVTGKIDQSLLTLTR